MDPATIRFRLAVPWVVFAAAPGLSALHASRARTTHPHAFDDTDPPPCPRCASLLVTHARSLRKRHRRILRRSCLVCAVVSDTVLPTVPDPPAPSPSPLAPSPNPPAPSPPPLSLTPKSRPKKKSGLHHLLARNREHEQREHQRQQKLFYQPGGLAAFLNDLD